MDGSRFRDDSPYGPGGRVRDSYTGYYWCGKDRHLLTPENRNAAGACRDCTNEAHRQRYQRTANPAVRGPYRKKQ